MERRSEEMTLRSLLAGLVPVGRFDRRAMRGGPLHPVGPLEDAGAAESPVRRWDASRGRGRLRLGQLDPWPV